MRGWEPGVRLEQKEILHERLEERTGLGGGAISEAVAVWRTGEEEYCRADEKTGVLWGKGLWSEGVVSPEANVDYTERRRGPRYPFIASAELIEEQADVRIASRVSELSRNGCYLDMMNPFPTGTMVLVKIFAGQDFFQSKGKVVYSQMNMGAGVGFTETEQESVVVLERWLTEAKQEAEKNQ